MIGRASSLALVCALVALPIGVSAQRHGGGGGAARGGGGARPAPAAPVSRPAQAPVARPAAPPAGSFNFSHDIAPAAAPARPAPARPAPARTAPVTVRPAAPARTAPVARRANGGGGSRVAYRRAPVTSSATGGAFHGHFNGHPIENNHWHGNWAWNHGAPWNPAPIYWGGGFWGDFAIASIGALGIFGAIEDSQDGYVYDSYQVEPDTPGADLLADYDLQQVPCGPPGLVDIWGPDGSVICAAPNDEVGSGDYEVDPETFTLVPAT
jgi:hypothetical protein